MSDILISLLEPFTFDFMQDAFLLVLLALIPAAFLSCIVVLHGWSLMGDAVSHAVLPGLLIATLIKIPVLLGAFLAGLGTVILSGFVESNSRLKRDTVLGIVFSSMFGLGLVIFSAFPINLHIDRILFGDLLGVTDEDILLTAVIGLVICLVIICKWRDIMLFIFDSVHFRSLKLPYKGFYYGLLALIALSVVGTLKTVGLLLSIAMLITPGVLALMVTHRFGTMLFVSALIAGLSGLLGAYLSFFLDSAPSATIVLIQVIFFIFLSLLPHRYRR